MQFGIQFTDAAKATLKLLPRAVVAEVLDTIEAILTHQPELESRSRIKRLREFQVPSYRLRVGDHRVFYSIMDGDVVIHAVVSKASASDWLAQFGTK